MVTEVYSWTSVLESLCLPGPYPSYTPVERVSGGRRVPMGETSTGDERLSRSQLNVSSGRRIVERQDRVDNRPFPVRNWCEYKEGAGGGETLKHGHTPP